MTNEQTEQIIELLTKIVKLLENNNQPGTAQKITVVNTSGAGRPPKGLKSDEDFTL